MPSGAHDTARAAGACAPRATIEELLAGAQGYLSLELIGFAEGAVALSESDISDSSARNYKWLTRHYQRFVGSEKLDPFGSRTVIVYFGKCFDEVVKKATLGACLMASGAWRTGAGLSDPLLDLIVDKVRGGAFDRLASQPRRVTPATVGKLGALVQVARTLAERRSTKLSVRQRDLLAKRDTGSTACATAASQRRSIPEIFLTAVFDLLIAAATG